MSVLTGMRAFAAVARHRNFRAAADELHVSPSALSHAVAGLESELGVRLLHRTSRSVALSDGGEHLLARLAPALALLDDAIASARDFSVTPRGTLRINASIGAARQVLMPYVAEFVRRYPEVQLELVTDDRLVDIVADGFDAGVRASSLVARDMVAVPCSPRVRFAIAGAPSYFARHPPPKRPDDLRVHDCIRYRLPNGRVWAWELEHRGRPIRIDVRGSLVVGNDALVHRAALDGLGLGYLSEWTIAEDVAAGRLVRVLDRWFRDDDALCLYYPAHRHVSASLRAFVGVVRDYMRKARSARR
jgi:DNA-binding transcriptional LysR family regulator